MKAIKILIVEDELLIARSLAKKLEKLGYEITAIVSSGQGAIESLNQVCPDLILMDIVIKGDKDGIETAEEIHNNYGIPVVFLTAYADDATLQRAEKTGSYSYILKPYSEQQLHANIKIALKKHQEYKFLHEKSIRDPLTGLFNRGYLEENLSKEIERAKRNHDLMSVIMVDIDHFKRFNDNYGHDAGDMVIKSVANLLQNNIRSYDFVCRYGGEEMTIILLQTSCEQAYKRAESIRKIIAQQEIFYQSQKIESVTISLGIATFPQHGTNANTLVQAADQALYLAKAQGRNRVIIAGN